MFLVETLAICFVASRKKSKNATIFKHKCFCQLLYSQFYAIIIIGILYAQGNYAMKRMMIALLAVVMLLSITACSDNNSNNGSTTDGTTVSTSEYVGEWKANTVSGLIDGEKTYTVSVIELKEDGTGTYKGRELSWAYSEEQNTINVTLLKENQTTAFEIQEVDGVTILRFFDDIYYRAEDFVPNN